MNDFFGSVKDWKLFQAIVDTTRDMVHLNDSDGRILYVNPVTEEMLGYKTGEIINTHSFEIIHCDDHEKVKQDMISLVLHKKEPPPREIRLLKKDGNYIDVEVRGFSVSYLGREFIGAVIRNISFRKKYEKEREKIVAKSIGQSKLASLGKFATGIAHEINQPLTYIKIMLESLLRDLQEGRCDLDELEEDSRESLRQINRITQLIDHIRTFSREERFTVGRIRLEEILANTLVVMAQHMKLGNIKYKSYIEDGLPPLWGNGIKLEQVFINLFQNSIDALAGMKNGLIELSIYAENGAVKIIVNDNGEGVPEESADKIFEPFFTTREVGRGTGIGLSIVYGIIKEHHGEIICVPRRQGARFLITLPVGNRENS